jgi:hypothetical protein
MLLHRLGLVVAAAEVLAASHQGICDVCIQKSNSLRNQLIDVHRRLQHQG